MEEREDTKLKKAVKEAVTSKCDKIASDVDADLAKKVAAITSHYDALEAAATETFNIQYAAFIKHYQAVLDGKALPGRVSHVE